VSEPAISTSGERLYSRLLPIFQQDEDYGWFGRYLCGAIMDGTLQGLDDIVLGSEIDGVLYPPWVIVFVPAVCPDSWLPWSASVYGVTLTPGISAEAQRAEIEELPPQKRGGVEAMETAGKRTLTGSKTLNIFEQPNGLSYQMVAVSTPAQTPSEQATLNALLSQKAGGIKLTYVVTADWLVIELEQAYKGKDVHELEAAFASVHAVETHGVI
jgi:hypothetical protein